MTMANFASDGRDPSNDARWSKSTVDQLMLMVWDSPSSPLRCRSSKAAPKERFLSREWDVREVRALLAARRVRRGRLPAIPQCAHDTGRTWRACPARLKPAAFH